MAKVYLGVGHGGADSGAVANGLVEKNVNLDVALACKSMLEDYGVSVKISRTDDTDMGINAKVAQANKWDADYVVEIHHNAGGGKGVEVYHSINGGKGKTLAQNILDSIVAIGQKSRGLKTRVTTDGRNYFGIIRDTDAPAVLVECAFLDSEDYKSVATAEKRKKMGNAVASGIIKTLGITQKPAEKVIYKVQLGAFSKKSNATALAKKVQEAGFDAVVIKENS